MDGIDDIDHAVLAAHYERALEVISTLVADAGTLRRYAYWALRRHQATDSDSFGEHGP